MYLGVENILELNTISNEDVREMIFLGVYYDKWILLSISQIKTYFGTEHIVKLHDM